MKVDDYLLLYTKINSKWIKDLNTDFELLKPLNVVTGGKFPDIGFGNDFFDLTLKA